MKNYFKRIVILTLAVFSLHCKMSAELPGPAALTREAIIGARYELAAKTAADFLMENINSPSCTSSALVFYLNALRQAYNHLDKSVEYEQLCKDLFSKIDSSQSGTLTRAFFLIALDCKGDYNKLRKEWHTFNLQGDNSAGIIFFDANVSKLPNTLLSKNPLLNAWIHIIKADILAYGGMFEEAEAEVNEAAIILKSNYKTGSPELLIEGFAQEVIAAEQKDWRKAAAIGEKNRDAISTINPECKELIACEARLQQYYYNLGEFVKSASYGQSASIRQSLFDAKPLLINYRSIQGPDLDNSPSSWFADRDYNTIHLTLARALFAQGKHVEGAKSADRVLYGLQKDIAANYSDFAFNRADDELKGKVDMLVLTAPELSLKAPQDSLLQSLAYDASLIYKQLSLSAGTLYRDAVARMGNMTISERYRELEQCRKALDLADASKVDSLVNRIAVLEANIQKNVDNRFKTAPGMLTRWKDVRNALKHGDAAVEFSIATTDLGNRYTASLLTHDSPYPTVFDLCAVEDFDNIKDLWANTDAYNLLWKPLEDNLQHVTTIYFSPAGNLNLLPIEYLPITEHEFFNDRYNAFRLSSTRWLTQRSENAAPHAVTLYGGVKYDLDESELTANESAADKASERFFTDSFKVVDTEAKGLRAGIAYLPATVEEINDIASIFSASQKPSTRIEGAEATETSIKELSSKDIPVLHIATHGFTVPRKSRSRLGRVLAQNDDRSTFEEQSLGRSGLMMAGAANTVDNKDKKAVMKFDDGILTGREISRLDLSNVGIVVLSACESGLGEVGSEGVSGLQRGLKKAGVRTLVMSLWKVSDEGTAILMTDFYRNLLNGQNAAQSMRNAQKHLRSIDNGKFADPSFWAPFIILDAI